MRLLAWLLLSLLAPLVQAHKASDSYLFFTVEDAIVHIQWDLALRDLDYAMGIDGNDDGEITWGELRQRHTELAAYALSRLRIGTPEGPCAPQVEHQLVDHHSDGAYAVLQFRAACPHTVRRLTVEYQLFFDLDPQHRGLARVSHEGTTQSAIFSPEASRQSFDLGASTPGKEFLAYARTGVWHIWLGYDHLLFLLSLLLPAVLSLKNGHWEPVARFRPAAAEVVKIVTAFTLAHSLTLSLAVLGFIVLPARWVESAIAASVVLAALNNLYPLCDSRRWLVAFAFGLVHGLGFANVLADLGLPKGSLVVGLLGFNLGVELGQLAMVAGFLPLAYRLRHGLFYRRLALGMGSAVIALIAALWLVERSFDLRPLFPL